MLRARKGRSNMNDMSCFSKTCSLPCRRQSDLFWNKLSEGHCGTSTLVMHIRHNDPPLHLPAPVDGKRWLPLVNSKKSMVGRTNALGSICIVSQVL